MLRVYIFTFVGEYVFIKFETDDEAQEFPFNDDETIKDMMLGYNVSELLITHKCKQLHPDELLANIYMQTSRENPINVRICVVWVSVDGSLAKKKRYRSFDTLGALYDENHFLVEFEGKPLDPDELLADIYMQTNRENPINVRTCVVWVSVDGSLAKKKRYRVFETLGSLYDENLFLVAFEGSVREGSCNVREFSTTMDNPLHVKTISKYVKLSERVSIDISSSNPLEQLANLKGNMVVIRGIKLEPCAVNFRQAISEGCEVKIVKKTQGIKDFALSAASVTTSAGRVKLMGKAKKYGLYTNWFAMSLYDCTKVEDDSLELAKQVQKILKLDSDMNELRLNDCELTYTSLLSEAFDHFMRKDGHCCLHQCSIYNSSVPDFFMASLNDGLPQHPKLIADFKVDEFKNAEAQSFHYCMAMANQTENNYPILTMPCTSEKFEMHLCIPESYEQMAYIKIMEAEVADKDKLALFFTIMRLGVNTLQRDMFGNKPFAIMPKRNLTFEDEENLSQQRVFKHNDSGNIRVYKLYDGWRFGSPNVEIIRTLGDDYLGKVELEKITIDGHIKLLSYDYQRVESGKEKILECYQPIIEALDMLHSKAIVHSDVRLRNMLFLCDGDAKLIDFDLADKVDTTYPDNYHSNFEYRHKDAKPGEKRKIDHDRYSLLCIIDILAYLTPEQKRKIVILKEKNDIPLASLFDHEQGNIC